MKKIWYKIARYAIRKLTTNELHSLLREYRELLILVKQERCFDIETGFYMVTLETNKKYKLFYNKLNDSWHYVNPIRLCGKGTEINTRPNSVKTIINVRKIKTKLELEKVG